ISLPKYPTLAQTPFHPYSPKASTPFSSHKALLKSSSLKNPFSFLFSVPGCIEYSVNVKKMFPRFGERNRKDEFIPLGKITE
ncbi:hypothetical protein ABDH65_17950, partial [Heyndrickxia ginsengihumi]|uniref:hypothetical protein n=1 Tax=Heyndrickxia ginsengihumi TaxID=363870 RepID=UPI003D196FB7